MTKTTLIKKDKKVYNTKFDVIIDISRDNSYGHVTSNHTVREIINDLRTFKSSQRRSYQFLLDIADIIENKE